jgi:hypothetical protein
MTGRLAGHVQAGRGRVAAERVEGGRVDRLGLGVDVLDIAAERPLVVRIVLQVQRVVRGHRAALGIAGVDGRRAQAGPARRARQRALGEVTGAVIGEAGARSRTVGRARIEADGVLGRGHQGRRAQELQRRLPLVVRAPLQGGVDALALAIEVQGAIAEAAGDIDRLARDQVGADEIGVDRDGVGAALQLGVRQVDQEADLAETRLEAVAVEDRAAGLPLLGQVAVRAVDRVGDDALDDVERQARAQVDRAAGAALHDVGGGILVDVHAGHQLGRDILERQRAAALGREAVAAVQFAAHPAEAAHLHARALDRQAVGVATVRGAADGDAGHALQASVTERSGRAPMSVEVIESTSCSAFCLIFWADWMAARWPVTTTSSTVVSLMGLS